MKELVEEKNDFVIYAEPSSLERISKKIAFSCSQINSHEQQFLHIKTVFNINDIRKNLIGEDYKLQVLGKKTGISFEAPCLN